MKTSKLETLYLFLSLIVIGFAAFIYTTYNRQFHSGSTTTTTKASSKLLSSSSSNTDYSQYQTKLDELEKEPNAENIASLKTEIETLKDSTEKTELLEKLVKLESDFSTMASIEENLSLAESTGNIDYFWSAQNGIDSLNSDNKKTELQSRLNTLYTNWTGLSWTGQ